ncbi:MAG TPA: GNAT family N-acetyltransferase [Mesorhizobium sp.]
MPDAALTEFSATPPGRTAADKFVFGLIDCQQSIVGLIECDRGWPEPGCWWIGLMLIHPIARGSGVAPAFLAGFAEWVAAQGAGRIELAVLDENERGQRFWRRQGFKHLRSTEPRTIGTKQHILHVLRRELV